MISDIMTLYTNATSYGNFVSFKFITVTSLVVESFTAHGLLNID
jgi:hypothetical protein